MKTAVKRLIPVLLSLVLLLALMPVTAYAESGTCGSGVNWTYQNGTLSITGEGDMTNYTSTTYAPWDETSFTNDITAVVIGNKVTRVGNYAFYGLSNLTSVTLNEGLKTIGSYAFYFCPSLTELAIPSTVENILNSAFSNKVTERESGDIVYGAIEKITFAGSSLQAVGSSLFKTGNLNNAVIYAPAGFAIGSDEAPSGKTGAAPFYNNYCVYTNGKATVSWENEDGTVLKTDAGLAPGSVPVYSGDDPVKEADDDWFYTFSGWDPVPSQVAANTLYIFKATFTQEDRYRITLKGHTLTLDGDIGVNFYYEILSVTDEAYAELTVDGGEPFTVPINFDAYQMIDGIKAYRFSCNVNASESSKVITCVVYNCDRASEEEVYSVNQYINDSQTVEDKNLSNLMGSLADYGYYSHLLFEPDADFTPASISSYTGSIEGVSADSFNAFAPDITNGNGGVNYYGMSLVLRTETAIKYYFSIPKGKSIDDYSFSLLIPGGEKQLTPEKSGKYYYVEISNIESANLDTEYTVAVRNSDGDTVNVWTGSALTYAYKVMNAESGSVSDELINVCKALYLYNVYANAYFI